VDLRPDEQVLLQRLGDALQMALLLMTRLAPDMRRSADDAAQVLAALTRAVQALKQLQLAETARRRTTGRSRRQAKADLRSASPSARTTTARAGGRRKS